MSAAVVRRRTLTAAVVLCESLPSVVSSDLRLPYTRIRMLLNSDHVRDVVHLELLFPNFWRHFLKMSLRIFENVTFGFCLELNIQDRRADNSSPSVSDQCYQCQGV